MSRAVRYDEVGGPEVLYVTEVTDPEPRDGQVVVDVEAVGLNFWDAKARSGIVPLKSAFPRGLGGDFAGVVSRDGLGAQYFDGSYVQAGDEVLGWGVSTLRDRLAVSSTNLARKPEGLPWGVAASLATPGLTAVACARAVPIGPDDTVLVGAASGGVGFLYGQIAHRMGARVIGTASPANHDRLRAVGIEPVEYGDGLADRVRALGTVTAVMDAQGRATVEVALALGVDPDRICTIADYPGASEFGLVTPGGDRSADVLQELADHVAAGDLSLPVQEEFALDDLHDAFRLLESRHLSGKIVVRF
jgi:NADPH:quinone reductase-like Zn-dependent oxidoreductase